MKKMRKLLLPFSLLYWLVSAVRNWFFDIGFLKSEKVGAPVISVGNISAGGVGKTPFIELLIDTITPFGRLSVVSRGYGRKSAGTVVVSDGCGKIDSVENSGDEPVQLALKFPKLIVVVDEQRVRGACKAIELGAEVILLDDGFQHRYLHRDLDIVLLTSKEILKGDLLLPAGNRREPWNSLNRADLIVITRCADEQEYEKAVTIGCARQLLPKEKPIVGVKTKVKTFKQYSTKEVMNADLLKGKTAVAFSGIGNPASFDEILNSAHIQVLKHIVFSDHRWYRESDIQRLGDIKIQTHADFLITTEKDAVKLRNKFEDFLKSVSIVVVEIQQEFIPGNIKIDDLFRRLKETGGNVEQK